MANETIGKSERKAVGWVTVVIFVLLGLFLAALPFLIMAAPWAWVAMEEDARKRGEADGVQFAQDELVPQLSDDATVDVHPEVINVTLPQRDLAEVEHTLDAYGTWLGEFQKKLEGVSTPDLEIVAGEGLTVITLGPDGKDATVEALPVVENYIEKGGTAVLRDTKDDPTVLLTGNEDAARQLAPELPAYYATVIYTDEPIVGEPDDFDDGFIAPRERFGELMDLRAELTAEIASRGLTGVEVIGLDGRFKLDRGEPATDIDLRTDSEEPGCVDPAAGQGLFDLFEGLPGNDEIRVVTVSCRVDTATVWPAQYRDE